MGRLRYAFAALLLIPLLDALFLAYVASAILGWEWTVLLVVLTALLGMLFVRAEGRHTIRKIQQAMLEGRAPTDELIDGGMLIAAGAFLLTPGLVTDAIGFVLVLPITRIPLRKLLKRFVIVPYVDAQTGGFASGNVYTFGFPGDGDGSARTPGGWTPGGDGDSSDQGGFGGFGGDDGPGGFNPFDGPGGQRDDSDEDTVDLGPDAYDVEFEDDDPDDSDDETDRGQRD